MLRLLGFADIYNIELATAESVGGQGTARSTFPPMAQSEISAGREARDISEEKRRR